MKSVDELVKKKIELLETKVGAKSYEFLLFEWHTVTEVSQKVYPHLYGERKKLEVNQKKKLRSRTYKKRPHSAISKYIDAFNKLGWLKQKNTRDKRKHLYTATLIPYLQYLRQKGITLNIKEKEFLIHEIKEFYCFLDLNESNLFSKLDSVTRMVIFYHINSLKSHRMIKRYSKISLAIDLSIKMFDKEMLKLLNEYLQTKILHLYRDVYAEKEALSATNMLKKLDDSLMKINHPD